MSKQTADVVVIGMGPGGEDVGGKLAEAFGPFEASPAPTPASTTSSHREVRFAQWPSVPWSASKAVAVAQP